MKTGRSGAKFILSGEHSIIYGGVALSFPISSLFLEYEETQNEKDQGVFLNQIKLDSSYCDKIIELRRSYELPELSAPHISIRSNIPMGSGLGSSAALCHALLNAHGLEDQKKKLEWCHRGEKILHGRSSGIDPYTVVLNKALCFHHNLKTEELSLESWKKSDFQFVLIDSSAQHSTKEAITQQSNLQQSDPQLWENCIAQLQELSQKMRVAFESSPSDCALLMENIHQELIKLGVSHPKIEETRVQLKKIGALASKITGAGRGGFVLALFNKKVAEQIDWSAIFPLRQVIRYELPSR